METGTFPKQEVQEIINTSFVPLKFESGRDAEQFHRFGIRATPTIVFLDKEGNEFHRVVGAYSAPDFARLLRDVSKGKTGHS